MLRCSFGVSIGMSSLQPVKVRIDTDEIGCPRWLVDGAMSSCRMSWSF
jgi:hypothetical protein